MCIAIPGQVIQVLEEKDKALVDIGGVSFKVHTGLIEEVHVGEFLLIHAGFAIEKVNQVFAKEALLYLNEIGEY